MKKYKCKICRKQRDKSSNVFCPICRKGIIEFVKTKENAIKWLDRDKDWKNIKKEILNICKK